MDLHIHSYASDYKEPNYENGESIVQNSKKENIDVLLDKLIENDISLFSITDHNRYDIELYKHLCEKLSKDKYSSLHLLHGVEIDTKLEEEKSIIHIVTIFNVKNEEDMKKISTIFKKFELSNKNKYYSKDELENILKKIGLDTLLIVHQRCSLDRSRGNHNSLSEGVADPFQIIQIGYIDALEYQKPNVEGILKNNLREVDSSIALITGSDCHDWKYYPKHDKNSNENSHYFSKCKILPSFKGLLLGLTSFNTRFNRFESANTNFINKFKINGDTIDLDPGINVIIGENGSGKSTLFSILSNESSQKQYIKKLKKENSISVDNNHLSLKAIKQAELVNRFEKDNLFRSENYLKEIDTSDFEQEYRYFANDLKFIIENNIRRKEEFVSLENKNFTLCMDFEESKTMYVTVTKDNLSSEVNKHTERRKQLAKVLKLLLEEVKEDYYTSKQKQVIFNSIMKIKSVYDEVENNEKQLDLNNQIKNLILSKIDDYDATINNCSTAEDQEIHDYKVKKSSFINDIANAIKVNSLKNKKLTLPKIYSGYSINRYNGYIFSKELNYNNQNVLDKFLEVMFVQNYRDINKLKKIISNNEFQEAINGCSTIEKIKDIWESNFNKFISWCKESKSYIKEETTDDSIGNTLGELSLVYYKFQTSEQDDWDVLMIDQPEDNISNNRIAEKMLEYLNSVRKNKQLIIVTHNPLLVVNLDADNVIFLKKINEKIEVKSGCLEDESSEILDIVAKTLDGGKDVIERRLKIYG